MVDTPRGKGYFTWKLMECEGGVPSAIAQVAQVTGLGHVLIKIADGTYAYNLSVDLEGICQKLFPLVELWAWVYIYGDQPAMEASRVITRLKMLPFFKGVVLDVEGEYKEPDKDAAARVYMDALRDAFPDLPIGLSSYRFPTYHQQVPWEVFLAKCDFVMPQVYWVGAHNPVEQLERSIKEYAALSDLPYLATGSAYSNSTWAATPADVTAFLVACKNKGMSGANFWEWAYAKRNLPEVFSAIANFPWPLDGEPVPPDETTDEKLDKIWDTVADLRTMVYDSYAKLDVMDDEVEKILSAVTTTPPVPPNPPPTPPPTPDTVYTFIMTEQPRANAFVQKGVNKEQVPMMVIYQDSQGKRVQFDVGDEVKIIKKAVVADGGLKLFALYDIKGQNKETLYVKKDSGTVKV